MKTLLIIFILGVIMIFLGLLWVQKAHGKVSLVRLIPLTLKFSWIWLVSEMGVMVILKSTVLTTLLGLGVVVLFLISRSKIGDERIALKELELGFELPKKLLKVGIVLIGTVYWIVILAIIGLIRMIVLM